MKTVSVIGYGEIGSALVQRISDLDGWRLGRVLTRHPVPGLPGHTTEAEAFLGHRADLIIDSAGPDALRDFGPGALSLAPFWSVGAVAMADAAFHARIATVSAQSGHPLRLFACGMANMPLQARKLEITMRGPEIEEPWTGTLSRAVVRWPDRLNTAVAMALNGPGLEATVLTMESGGVDTPHEIDVRAEGDGIRWHSTGPSASRRAPMRRIRSRRCC
ncbi:hypothetical protein AB2B41_09260 [Marimonas sp. MJW-29]|uniref:Aspartate dehydrogenase n=1 Tax=Sulfitobacter sediminis TaxID=3234186 RepID=A0ABV3RLD3_9RHOB